MSKENTVITCVVGTTTLTYIAKFTGEGEVTIKPLIGMFVAGVLLLIVAMVNDDLAVAFAVLMFVTAFLVNGVTVFGEVSEHLS